MILSHDFSLTLTTLALDQSSLRWFEARSCKPAPRGFPSSLAQLRTPSKNKCALLAHFIADIGPPEEGGSGIASGAFCKEGRLASYMI